MCRYKIVFIFLGMLTTIAACKKQEAGFISDGMFYVENPFYVQQGETKASQSLVFDGSTQPLTTTVLSIRNKQTGESADSLFMKPQTIPVYTGTVTYLDSTLDMLRSKVKDSTIAPFIIGKFGGRLQFTQSSKYLIPGTYTLDIAVSNIRGTRILENACDMVITPGTVSNAFEIAAKSWKLVDTFGVTTDVQDELMIDVTYDSSADNQVIFKFMDKNNKYFNPMKDSEVVGPKFLPSFANWDPYYKPVKTDTSLEFQYPTSIPKLPVYLTTVLDGKNYTDGIFYYMIPYKSNDLGQNLIFSLTPRFNYPKGRYTIIFHLSNVRRVF